MRNLLIAASGTAAAWGIAWLVGFRTGSFAASLATAYVGLALLAVTLLLGPFNVLLGRANPLSTHLRRDLGIWAGVFSLAHVVIGLRRHMSGRWWLYFTFPDLRGRLFGIRYDAFGTTNWIGLAATVIIAVLILISSDVALRRLGTTRWKWIQRWNYVLFLGVVVHGFVYQELEGLDRTVRASALAAVFLLVAVLQALGARRVRRLRTSAARSTSPIGDGGGGSGDAGR